MTTSTPGSPGEELSELFERLARTARMRGFDVQEAPDLARNIFKGGQANDVARLSPTELPEAVRAFTFGRYTFVLGLLPAEPTQEAVTECLRRFRNQCVVARSFLSPNQALDLQGVLMGPRGSEPSDEWRALALVVERDERVARKFAWLRPASPSADERSFNELVRRTVLARPWVSNATFSMAALDDLSRTAGELEAGVPRTTVERWIHLALTTGDNPRQLVDDLVSAWKERGIR